MMQMLYETIHRYMRTKKRSVPADLQSLELSARAIRIRGVEYCSCNRLQ